MKTWTKYLQDFVLPIVSCTPDDTKPKVFVDPCKDSSDFRSLAGTLAKVCN